MFRRFLTATLLGLVVVLPASTVFAGSVEQQVTVQGSGLQVTQTPVQFSDVTLDVKKSQSSEAKTKLYVLDGRGTDAGWGVLLRTTDFKLVKQVNGVDEVFSIPASAITVTTTYGGPIVGNSIDFAGGEGFLGSSVILSNKDERLLATNKRYGAGTHQFDLNYHLQLPKTIKGSNGTVSGVLQGTYTATFTYTVTAGI